MQLEHLDQLFQVPSEMRRTILLELPDKDLLSLCSTNKKFSKFCEDEDLWKLKTQEKMKYMYSIVKRKRNQQTWQDYYIQLKQSPSFYWINRNLSEFSNYIRSVSTTLINLGKHSFPIPETNDHKKLSLKTGDIVTIWVSDKIADIFFVKRVNKESMEIQRINIDNRRAELIFMKGVYEILAKIGMNQYEPYVNYVMHAIGFDPKIETIPFLVLFVDSGVEYSFDGTKFNILSN